ncbi:Microtubule-associated protein Jupiter, partial [Stegodyphus mimosarum]
MAPVYDFRHVELDKIGRGKRIVKPPGGECSDIFGVQNGGSPAQEQITPRKTKNYMQSNIFSPDSPDAPQPQNGHTNISPAKLLDTQERLFGGSGEEETPRRVVNRQRSSIFEEEVVDSRPRSTPVRRNQINPITGASIYENGSSNDSTPNGTSNGRINGYTNGSSGHTTPESPMNGNVRIRNPPGGRSSGIF